MKKKGLFAALCVFALLVFPHTSLAKMTALTDMQLEKVVGQAGIAIEVDNLDFDINIDTIFYGDKDGLGGITQGGYLSLCDVVLKGGIDFVKPMTIDVVTQQTQFGTEISSLDIHMSDMTIDIDEFYIDAIRLGPEPGTGASLGSFGIWGLHADITGDISISVRP